MLRHWRWLLGRLGGRVRAARWPSTLAAGLARAAGPRTHCRSEGTGCLGGRSGGAVPSPGLGCLLREQPVERRRSRRGQVALCTRPSCQAWGRRVARERPGSEEHHVPQTKAQKPVPNSPQGAEMKCQRRKCLTMAENKGELHGDLLAPAPDAARCPRPARLRARCRSPTALLSSEPSLKPGRESGAQHLRVHEREWGSMGRIRVQAGVGSELADPYERFIQ